MVIFHSYVKLPEGNISLSSMDGQTRNTSAVCYLHCFPSPFRAPTDFKFGFLKSSLGNTLWCHQTWLENPLWKWRVLARNIIYQWYIFQQAMFDYRRVMPKRICDMFHFHASGTIQSRPRILNTSVDRIWSWLGSETWVASDSGMG